MWFVVGEVHALEGLFDVEVARVAVGVGAIPIVDAVGGVGVLLDFEQHDARAEGVDASRWDEENVAAFGGDAVEKVGDVALFECVGEFLARDAAFESEINFGIRRGVGDPPHFGFGFAAEFRRDGGGRVDLDGKFIAGVKPFDQNGEWLVGRLEGWRRERFWILGFRFWVRSAEYFFRVMVEQPAERFVGVTTVGDETAIGGAVHKLPRLADGLIRRKRFVKEPFQFASAPEPLLEDGVKFQWIKHGFGIERVEGGKSGIAD